MYREKEMLDSLKGYLQAEQDRLEVIKRFTEKLDQIHSAIPQENVERHLGHPSNSYLLIKRFVKEWPAIEELSKNPSSESMFFYYLCVV